jgi:hypothetical protein
MDHARMFGWAETQLKSLDEHIGAFLATDPYDLVAEDDRVTGEKVIRARPVRLPDKDLVMLVGQVIHSFRVSLDYLAFEIGEKRFPDFTKADPKRVSFPICHDFEKSWGGYSGKVRKWGGDDAVDLIESFQPHNGRKTPESEALRILDELEGPHKHRKLLAAGSAVVQNALRILHDPRGSFKFNIVRMGGGAFDENGAEVLRIRFRARPDPEAKMACDAIFGVAFAKEGPARGGEVIHTLEGIRDRLRDDIIPKVEGLLT